MNRKEEVARHFAKFGLLSVRELQAIYGGHPSKRQLNRYLVELSRDGRIERRAHPSRYVFAFEATGKVLHESQKNKITTFQRQNGRQIVHRMESASALVNLCRRSRVTGVAIEHELQPEDLKKFCTGRVPDGTVQVAGLGQNPVELAVEVECVLKSRKRAKEILDAYQVTTEGTRHQCRGAIIFASEETIYKQYESLLSEYPESFQRKVIVSRGTGTEDIPPSVLGERLPSALTNRYLPCLSRRSSSRGLVEFL